jgi:general nucleoside transport system permease protein
MPISDRPPRLRERRRSPIGWRSWAVEYRPNPKGAAWYRLGAVAIGMVVGVVVATALVAVPAGDFLGYLWTGTVGSGISVQSILTLTTPLILTGLAAAIPYRVGFWNIGGEGQFLLGGWAATGVGFAAPGLPGAVLIFLMLAAACLAGALWALLPALLRVYLGVNEIITTLLMNFVASYFVLYWVTHVWLEPLSAGGVKSRLLPAQSFLPTVSVTPTWGIPAGLFLSVAAGLGIAGYFAQSRFGYEISVIGSSERVGKYAGIPTARRLVTVMLLGGALAGLGGAVELLGDVHRLAITISNNTGYTGVVIAVLAAGSALGVIGVAGLFGLIFVGGEVLTVWGTSSDVVFAITGMILVLAAIGQGICHLRLVRTRDEAPPAQIKSSKKEETFVV